VGIARLVAHAADETSIVCSFVAIL